MRLGRLRRLADRSALAGWRAAVEFVEHRGHRDAAQIGFFAVLSFVPLAMLLVGAFGLVLDDREVRERVVGAVFDNVPLSRQEDRDRLERAVSGSLDRAGSVGPVSLLLLLAAATGVMGALRHAVNEAWDLEQRRPLLRRKALDLALVSVATMVLVFSASLTVTRRVADDVGDEDGGGLASMLIDAVGDLLPFAFTTLVVAFLFKVLPSPRPRTRDIWPGAIVAAAGISVVRNLLELYFERFADLGALYGSLGALMALLLFVFAASIAVVYGAEYSAEWSRLPRDGREVRSELRVAACRALQRLRRT